MIEFCGIFFPSPNYKNILPTLFMKLDRDKWLLRNGEIRRRNHTKTINYLLRSISFRRQDYVGEKGRHLT